MVFQIRRINLGTKNEANAIKQDGKNEKKKKKTEDNENHSGQT